MALGHLHIGGNISGDRRLGLGLNLIWKVLIKNSIISPKILMTYDRSGGKNEIFRLPNNYFVVLYQLHMGGNISGDRMFRVRVKPHMEGFH